MARLTVGQKVHRTVQLILGLKLPRVAAMLAAYGFSQEDLDEGWALLRAVTGERLSVTPIPAPPDPALLDVLDGWENKWLEIAEATLRRNFADVRDEVFLNLSRTSGRDVVISVDTFVTRVEALENGTQRHKEARALLEKRGLTQATIQEAKDLLAKLGTITPLELPKLDPVKAKEAEDALWAWYLEWSAIARSAIHDPRLLRALGFLRTTSKGGVDAEDENEDDGDGDGDDDDGAVDDVAPVTPV